MSVTTAYACASAPDAADAEPGWYETGDSATDADSGGTTDGETGFDFGGEWYAVSARLPCERQVVVGFGDAGVYSVGAYFGSGLVSGTNAVSAFDGQALPLAGEVGLLVQETSTHAIWGSTGETGTITVGVGESGAATVSWQQVTLESAAHEPGVSDSGLLICT